MDGECVEESCSFLNKASAQISTLENEAFIPIMDQVLQPVRRTGRTLAEIAHSMEQIVYLNQELVEEAEISLQQRFGENYTTNECHEKSNINEEDRPHACNYSSPSNESKYKDGTNQLEIESSSQCGVPIEDLMAKHRALKPYKVLSPLEEGDESLLVEEDDDNDDGGNRMKQISNPLLDKFLLQSPSFKRTPSPVAYQQPVVVPEEIVCSEEEPISLPNTPSFQNVALR